MSAEARTPDDPLFLKALAFVRRCEGGYVHDPVDRGGPTNCGVTQVTFDTYLLAHERPLRSVATITEAEADDVYRQLYWAATHCAAFPAPVAVALFDAAVQHGPGMAVRLLQEVVGARRDGRVGPETVGAVERIGGFLVAKRFCRRRLVLYARIIAKRPAQIRFARGWLNRIRMLKQLVRAVKEG